MRTTIRKTLAGTPIKNTPFYLHIYHHGMHILFNYILYNRTTEIFKSYLFHGIALRDRYFGVCLKHLLYGGSYGVRRFRYLCPSWFSAAAAVRRGAVLAVFIINLIFFCLCQSNPVSVSATLELATVSKLSVPARSNYS